MLKPRNRTRNSSSTRVQVVVGDMLALDVTGQYACKQALSRRARENLAIELQAMIVMDDHPNIVKCIGYEGDFKAPTSMVMEVCDGDLVDVCNRPRNPLCLHQRLKTLLQLLQALRTAQSFGLAHVDLKPENVMKVWNETRTFFDVKIGDWGMVKALGSQSNQPGTEVYMPPEVRDAVEETGYYHVTHAIDMFSLGLIMLQMSTKGSFISMSSGCIELLYHLMSEGELLDTMIQGGYVNEPEDNLWISVLEWMLDPRWLKRPTVDELYKSVSHMVCEGATGLLQWKPELVAQCKVPQPVIATAGSDERSSKQTDDGSIGVCGALPQFSNNRSGRSPSIPARMGRQAKAAAAEAAAASQQAVVSFAEEALTMRVSQQAEWVLQD